MFTRCGAVPLTELQLTAAKHLLDASGHDHKTICQSLHEVNTLMRAHAFTRYRQPDAFTPTFDPVPGSLEGVPVEKRSSILLDESCWNYLPAGVHPLCLGSGMLLLPNAQLRLHDDLLLGMVLEVVGRVFVGVTYTGDKEISGKRRLKPVVVDLPFSHDDDDDTPPTRKWPLAPNTRIGNILITDPGAYLDEHLVLHGPFALLDVTKAPRWDQAIVEGLPLTDLHSMILARFTSSYLLFPDGVIGGTDDGDGRYHEVCQDALVYEKLRLDPHARAALEPLCYGFPCDFVPVWSPATDVLYSNASSAQEVQTTKKQKEEEAAQLPTEVAPPASHSQDSPRVSSMSAAQVVRGLAHKVAVVAASNSPRNYTAATSTQTTQAKKFKGLESWRRKAAEMIPGPPTQAPALSSLRRSGSKRS